MIRAHERLSNYLIYEMRDVSDLNLTPRVICCSQSILRLRFKKVARVCSEAYCLGAIARRTIAKKRMGDPFLESFFQTKARANFQRTKRPPHRRASIKWRS